MWQYLRSPVNLPIADETLFNELYHQYWELLFRIACKKTGSVEDASDIVHDLFADIWRNLRKVPAGDACRPYLISCLYHKVFNYFRTKGLQEKHYKHLELFLSQQLTGTELPMQEPVQELIDKAITTEIRKLPVKMKDILIRYFYQRQTIDQIAGELSLSRQTVKNQLSLASKRLRQAVQQLVVFLYCFFYS
ncbi:MAG: sigma-70 family RNA polymerase sigma factor [Candidatus Pseudobacter hemicellulosilyticus]|uniref:Sigma-70 family RNA polymerase sigma factor n=1 Tax=Candidatus Pseudobacter hemicellulosilyticus TaxID=3121375 RepID=A0AAJ5WR62_9BACT|nr:MAG: sigma-70 family RNA polymerase sigma factor [Pseudobacter sp.]